MLWVVQPVALLVALSATVRVAAKAVQLAALLADTLGSLMGGGKVVRMAARSEVLMEYREAVSWDVDLAGEWEFGKDCCWVC